LIRGLPNI